MTSGSQLCNNPLAEVTDVDVVAKLVAATANNRCFTKSWGGAKRCKTFSSCWPEP
jgi:hypothetical protein